MPYTGLKLSAVILTISLISGLSACGSNQNIPGAEPQAGSAEVLLKKAQTSFAPQRQAYQIQAAQVLSDQQQNPQAMKVLSQIAANQLPITLLSNFSLLYSQLALDSDSFFLTKRILTLPKLEQQLHLIPEPQRKILHQRRAEIFSLLLEPIKSLQEYMVLLPLISDPSKRLTYQEAIWQTLLTIPAQQFTELSSHETHPQLQGWYALASAVRNNQDNIEKQLSAVHQWIATWPEHPASLQLPEDIQQLEQLVQTRPKKIAIMLPSEGKLMKPSNAIRDGLMAAHYNAKRQGAFTPDLVFINSHEKTIEQLYLQAVEQNAQWVIGPLNKKLVAELSQRETLPLPTLALNYHPNEPEPASQLFQFGLAVEDEVKQIAQLAWLEGHREIAIIAPDNNWGQRAKQSFSTYWQELGGVVSSHSSYKSMHDYSSATEALLHTRSSKNRASRLRRVAGLNLEFEPRRRQDIDAIFMAALPQDGRQLKPTFAFHYAGNLPIYSTSKIYNGIEDRAKDRDLNKVRFTAPPWDFDKKNPIKKLLARNIKIKPGHSKLYALGIDAYHLAPKLPLLERMSNASHFGLTGTLKLNETRHVMRQSQWAYFRGGRARPLPLTVNNKK